MLLLLDATCEPSLAANFRGDDDASFTVRFRADVGRDRWRAGMGEGSLEPMGDVDADNKGDEMRTFGTVVVLLFVSNDTSSP